MCKTIGKVVLVGLVVVGGIVALKSSSYVATLWHNTRQAVARQVPRELEIDRVRLQISKLDGDVRGLLGPIAEKMAQVKKLEREVTTARQNVSEHGEFLVALTREVETGEKVVSVKGSEFTLKQAQAKLNRDFNSLKRTENALKSQEKVLEANRKNLQSTKEQLTIILDQKKEFEVRLAELEANEAWLGVARATTPLHVDDSRIADIKATLDAIDQAQQAETYLRDLEQQWGPRLQGNQQQSSANPTVDLIEVKNYLGIGANGNAVADSK